MKEVISINADLAVAPTLDGERGILRKENR
jgi:hypothetical protein